MTTASSMTPAEFTVAATIAEERIVDLLISAWEGGSNYWASAKGVPYREVDRSGKWELALPVTVIDLEGTNERLDRAAIQRGVSLAHNFPRVFAALTDDGRGVVSWDASDADVFLQLCLFGEVVYG